MNIRPIEFEVENLKLRGSLYEPDTGIIEGRRYPTAILFHGFGGNRVDVSGFIVQMAKALTAEGFIVITYDRAGHGESDGEFFDTSVTRDVKDASCVVKQVMELSYVDSSNLHMGGLSLGSVIASMTAALCDPQPRSMVMCSTAAVFVDEIASGKIQGRSINSLSTDGYFDFAGMKMGPAMVKDALKLDVYAEAAKYRGKVLLMHGTKDFVPLSYAQRYKEMWAENATLLVREGADHGWASVPDRQFVTQHAADFMAENAGLKKE